MSDAILDALNCECARVELDGVVEEILSLRAEVERLEAQVPRWISVEERLPENSTRCLICDVTGRQIFSEFDRLWGFYDSIFKVTHWMPLPEPPAMKEQSDE